MKTYFAELQRVRPAIAVPSSAEVFYLGRGWIQEAKTDPRADTSQKTLRSAAIIAKASGINCNAHAVDADVRQMLEESLGESVDPSKGNFSFLKDEDMTLSEVEKEMAAQLSFNYAVPKSVEDMKQMYEKLKKDGPEKPEDLPEGFSSAEEEAEDSTADSPISPQARQSAQSEAERLIDRLISNPEDPIFNEGPPLHNLEDALSEIDRQSGNPPEATEDIARKTKQKAQYDDWSQALKNKDIWGKGD